MTEAVIVLQIVNILALGIIALVIKNTLSSYLSEKGKNLATKEDVEEITRKIETVRAEVAKSQAVENSKRQLKHEACLQALSVIDAHFSQLFSNPKPTPQVADTVRARECHNKLILSCESVE